MLVLIVEDNALVAMDLREIVLENAAADIVMSTTVAGTRSLLDRPFDFAFFDVDLPDGNTYELATEMLAKNIPFVFVSGSKIGNLPRALQSVPFVAKPFTPSDIAHAMRHIPVLVH